MLLQVVILAGLIVWFSSCAVKHLPPAPVVGVDIVDLHKGDIVSFNGIEFSPYYLNQYLQWKNN